MAPSTIDRLIINSPYEGPARRWRHDPATRLFSLVEGRREAGYVVATPSGRFAARPPPWGRSMTSSVSPLSRAAYLHLGRAELDFHCTSVLGVLLRVTGLYVLAAERVKAKGGFRMAPRPVASTKR